MADFALDGVRFDFAADSMMVALPVPAELAAQVGRPDPHVTMVYVGPGTEAQAVEIALIVADELGTRWSLLGREPSDQIELFVRGAKAMLLGLDYFDNAERVAFARVSVPTDITALRDRIAARIAAIGIQLPSPGRGWVPHLTLAFLEPGQAYTGQVPTGEWAIDAVEVWRGPGTRLIVRTNGDVDRIELAGGRWTAYRKAGDKDIGSFGTEAEARAALIAVDNQRKLAGRHDAKPAAPAVHTETRNFIEETRADKLSLGPVVESNDDWSEYQVLYSRAEIVQPYRFDGRLFQEYRARSDVFEPASLKSGRGIPWEVKHSRALLNQDTVLGVAAGCTLTVEEHQDGLHTTGLAKAWDRHLRAHAKAGGDVSVAYRLKIDPRPGTTDSGQRFDRRQYHIRWNSLAAELAGNAGTARVLPTRADAKGLVITSAAEMLAAAQHARADSAPFYFDLSEWRRRSDAAPPELQPDPDQVQDTPMQSQLQILIAAAGVSPADLAAALGIAEPDLAMLIAGEIEMTPEQATKLLAKLAPAREDAPPASPAADLVVIKIGDKETKVPADVAAEMTVLAEKAAVAADRADRAEHRADAAEVEKRRIAGQLKAAQDSQGSMVSRTDADQMVRETALAYAEVIDLARRANGATWSPEVRQDAEGAEQPLSFADWQRGAIRGAYGDKADKIFERIDAAPAANQAALLQIRLDDARELIDAKAHKSGSVREAIDKSRDNEAQRRQDEATRGNKDVLAETQTEQQDHGANFVGATKKTA
jgi:2'-5' RNA ligase